MSSRLKLGVYEHYKGNRYEVIGVAEHTETQEAMVVYGALEGERKIWTRPLAVFLQEVEVDGKRVPRFKYIAEKAKT